MIIKVKVDNQVFILDEDGDFVCAHDDIEVEDHYYVCVDCGEELEGDPAQDRMEYLADMAIMEARGK